MISFIEKLIAMPYFDALVIVGAIGMAAGGLLYMVISLFVEDRGGEDEYKKETYY